MWSQMMTNRKFNRITSLLLCCVLVALVLVPSQFANAADPLSKDDPIIQDLNNKIEESKKKQEELEKEMANVKPSVDNLQSQINILQGQIDIIIISYLL